MGKRESKVSMDSVYAPSEDIVAREIEGEIIIIPLTSGVGDMEDELYTLNETGRVIWKAIDGKRSLKVISEELSLKFKADKNTIAEDIAGLVGELHKRKILVKL